MVGPSPAREYRLSRLPHQRSRTVFYSTQRSAPGWRKRARADRVEAFEPPVTARTRARSQAPGLSRHQKLFPRAVETGHALHVQPEVSRSGDNEARSAQRRRLCTRPVTKSEPVGDKLARIFAATRKRIRSTHDSTGQTRSRCVSGRSGQRRFARLHCRCRD